MSDNQNLIPPHVMHAVDAISAIAIAGTIIGYLPAITALAGLIWYGMQIYDWVENKLEKRKQLREQNESTPEL